MSLLLRVAIGAAALTVSGIVQAAWHKASTKHFIIYSEQKPDELRAFAEKLERFDKAVRIVRGSEDPPIGDGNRLTVFVVKSVDAVQRLHRDRDDAIYGFYLPRYTGSIAFVPADTGQEGKWDLSAAAVFFHEYAHHMMFQEADIPFPNWFVEGFAELFSTAKFERDNSVILGTAPAHRAYGLFGSDGLTIREILEAQPAKMTAAEQESIYGRGWLLTHYLTFEKSRKGQLAAYLTKLAKGQPMAEAANEAFGDLRQLGRELDNYVGKRKLPAITVAGTALNVGAIEVAPLTMGGNEVMAWRLVSKRGVNEAEARKVVEKVRAVAARHPADPLVQVTLAEAEFDAGNHKAALEAAEAATMADPKLIEALTYKGRALLELASKKDPGASFAAARKAFMAANQIDPEDPEPLFLFFDSFREEGKRPTANAVEALHYASTLAPQDPMVRSMSAVAYINEGKLPEARLELLPIGFNPHGGPMAERARAAIVRLEADDRKGAFEALAAVPADESSAGASKPPKERR